MRTFVLSIAALLLAGCSNDFEKQSQITRVRVLAIRATPPEITVPTQGPMIPPAVHFDALAVAPDDRPVTVRYALCRFGYPYTGNFECPGKDGFDLDGGVLDLTDPQVQRFLASQFDGGSAAGDGGSGGFPSGLQLTVGYFADDGRGTDRSTERGVHTIDVRQTDSPNQNPHLLDVIAGIDGGAAPTFPLNALPVGETLSFTPVLEDGGIESYPTATGTESEHVFYSWFATGDGGIQSLRSQEPVDGVGDRTTRFETPKAPEQLKLYVVARDGRGGVDWIVRDVNVGP